MLAIKRVMELIRQVQLKRSKLLDEITFHSKNLFNVATYAIRRRFFKDRYWIRYHELWNLLKTHDAYQVLQEECGSHPPQQVLKQVDRNFKSFFNAMKQWKKEPSNFYGMPRRKSNRKYRGLYACKDCGTVLNADVNASRNIMQKGVPESTWIGDRGCLNHPVVLRV